MPSAWLSHYWSLLTSCWMLVSLMGTKAVALPLVFASLITVHLGMFLLVFILAGTLSFLDLVDYFPSHVGDLSVIISSNIFSGPFSFGTPIMQSWWDLTSCASAGDPPVLAGRSGPCSYEVTSFSLDSYVHETLCGPSKSGVSASPSPGSSCDQIPLVFKAKFSGGFFSHCQTLSHGTWHGAQNFHFCGRTSVV